MLPSLQFSAAGRGFVRVLFLVMRVALIPPYEPGKRLIGGYRVRLVLSPSRHAEGYQRQAPAKAGPQRSKPFCIR
jgi:hypothetical protein